MKLCKDCRWFNGVSKARCLYVVVRSPIDGSRTLTSAVNNPLYQREEDGFMAFMNGQCGKSGRWWEPKISERIPSTDGSEHILGADGDD